jgi:hypothetical protein
MTQYQGVGTSFWRHKQVAINFETQYQNAGRHLACVFAAGRHSNATREAISRMRAAVVCIPYSIQACYYLATESLAGVCVHIHLGWCGSCICGLQAVSAKRAEFCFAILTFSFTASEYIHRGVLDKFASCRSQPPALSQLYLTESFDAWIQKKRSKLCAFAEWSEAPRSPPASAHFFALSYPACLSFPTVY